MIKDGIVMPSINGKVLFFFLLPEEFVDESGEIEVRHDLPAVHKSGLPVTLQQHKSNKNIENSNIVIHFRNDQLYYKIKYEDMKL